MLAETLYTSGGVWTSRLSLLLPQLRDAEHVGANVLLLVTDIPYFIRHLVARMQWEGTYRETWFPIFVNTLEAGQAAVHFTWAGPEIMTVLRVLAPGTVLILLDHDTLFTARWEAEELRRFAVLDLLPSSLSVEPLGKMDVEVDETQPCGSLPSSPWSCSPDRYIPSGARSPNSIGMVCASEDQLEANGGLVIFYPDAPDASCPQPPSAFRALLLKLWTSCVRRWPARLRDSSSPVECPLHCLACLLT